MYAEPVAYTPNGEAEAVLYHVLPAILLNELQRQQRELEAKTQALDELRRLEALEGRASTAR